MTYFADNAENADRIFLFFFSQSEHGDLEDNNVRPQMDADERRSRFNTSGIICVYLRDLRLISSLRPLCLCGELDARHDDLRDGSRMGS